MPKQTHGEPGKSLAVARPFVMHSFPEVMAEGEDIRRVVLEVIHGMEDKLQTRSVMDEIRKRLGPRSIEVERAILTCWYDLFRTGLLSWGQDLTNPEAPHVHFTEMGRRALQNFSRDPSNPDGYWAALDGAVANGSIAESYVLEALATYNSNCHRASAIMIGLAAESLLVELRDALLTRLAHLGRAPQKKDLKDSRIKLVLDALEIEFTSRAMPKQLAERFAASWSAFATHLRFVRNGAGRPTSVGPVTVDVVHGSLLIFPELAKLVADLNNWVQSESFS